MKRYNNYHKHTHYSNIRTLDCVSKPIDYIEQARKLGHTTYFTTEHGWGGNIWEANTLCKEHNLKCIFGVEAYYVDNRFEKDRGNYHIVLIALNNNGFQDINRIISEANETGFYYKPRIDLELLLSLNPNNVIITTACVASRLFKTENYEKEFLIPIYNHFKNNLFLEVQSHNEDIQKIHNKKILKLSKKYDIGIIHANDSHYINANDSKYRNLFLKAKDIIYPEEGNFILDYPSYDEVVERYQKQGILSEGEIIKALDNTLVFDKCEPVNLNYDIKLPKIHKDSLTELKKIVQNKWDEEKQNIPKEKLKEYIEGIKYEIDIIEKTHMADYFLLDYKIVNKAIKEYKGVLTRTGRGSAPSFYINKLLGFTDIDRFDSPVTLYPTRFMSPTRILKTKSLPDIDLNWADQEPPIKASKDILGEDGVYQMIAYKPLQESSAFRLWCKANDMKISEYDEVAKRLEDYVEDKYWKNIIENSKVFRGVIESIAPSPCSFLLYDKSITNDVGLIKIKSKEKGKNKELICCCLDKDNCDAYKYLKNDYLVVTVWSIIDKVCNLINKPVPTIKELNELLDNKTWKIYEEGLTATLNQAGSDFAMPLIKKYSPKTVGEMSAFVASIRPGFASLLNNFLERKPYSTEVNQLDELLKDSFHYLMYQESIMKYLVWLGIEESETYGIIKKISKKKFKQKELDELKKKLKTGWTNKVGDTEGFDKTWQVIEDASRYSFNASHSLSVGYDSLYGAYLKSHYPLEYYSVVLNTYEDNLKETSKITSELSYFNIEILQPKFRYSKAEYMFDKKTNSIYKGIASIKFLNEQVADELYSLRDNQYNDFIELLEDISSKTSCDSKKLDILIKLDFFEEFGKSKKLLKAVEIFNTYYGKKQFNKEKLNISLDIMRKFSNKETDKLFKEVDIPDLIKYLYSQLENEDISIREKIEEQVDKLGNCCIKDEKYPKTVMTILDVNTKYTPTLTVYRLNDGKTARIKIPKKIFKETPIEKFDLINIKESKVKNKRKFIDGEWKAIDEKELWVNLYSFIVE